MLQKFFIQAECVRLYCPVPHLQVVHEAVHLSGLEHGEHGLADVERVPPVVVLHRTVVLLHAQDPPAQILNEWLIETLCFW